ncbi:ethanolamine kinase 2 isoform 2-T2 [Guaruba guarouba]
MYRHRLCHPSALQLFTDGITNKLVACYTDEGMVDAVLVRVYGRKTELFVDRDTELRNFQVLRAHGCAPDLYCAFQNGLCYQFLPGIALGPDHVREPRIFRLVAQEMARVHAIHANGSLPKPILWQKLHKYLTLVKMDLSPKVSNPSLQQDVPSLEVLEQELAWMKETLSQLGSPVVLCHNDLLCKNIIYDGTRGHVRFIDYEYTGYNYQAFDIGNHFNEFAGVKEVDYSLYPSKDTQLQWLHSYLQAYKQLTQGDQGVSEEELEALYVQVNKFSLASHFLWACWGLIQDKYSTIDFNFLSPRIPLAPSPALLGREGRSGWWEGGREESSAPATDERRPWTLPRLDREMLREDHGLRRGPCLCEEAFTIALTSSPGAWQVRALLAPLLLCLAPGLLPLC